MNSTLFLLFVGAQLMASSVILLIACRGDRKFVALAAFALVGVIAISIVAAIRGPGAVPVLDTTRSLSPRVIVTLALGVIAGMPWAVALAPGGSTGRRRLIHAALCLVPFSLVLGTSILLWRPINHGALRTVDSNFVIEEVARFEEDPIRVAVDENDSVFVSLQLIGQENYSGRIVKLIKKPGESIPGVRVVADSPALFCPFGLAVRNGDILVSRRGFLAHADQGTISYANSGFVTRLRDLDGDGFMDHYHDVLSGLPGSQGPTPQHGNYGIAFGPNGSLFVASGAASNRDPLNHRWEGKILRISLDDSSVDIFADGFRNPFGLAIGPDGELFATDNDESMIDPGDELNHVVQGQHYGHPYVIGNDDGGGDFTRPLLLSPSNSTFTGLAYFDSPALPKEFRRCLYIADFLGNRIWRVSLDKQGANYFPEMHLFAEVPLPIDIAVTKSGQFYITSRHGALFRIRLNNSDI